jgi:hypothetical protein
MLAYPAALSANDGDVLPQISEDRSIIILALPRVMTETTALERFLTNNAGRALELLFFYENEKNRAEAAQTCANLYNKRAGVRAQTIGVEK